MAAKKASRVQQSRIVTMEKTAVKTFWGALTVLKTRENEKAVERLNEILQEGCVTSLTG